MMIDTKGLSISEKFDVFLSYSTSPDHLLSRKVESYLEKFHSLKLPDNITLKPLNVCRDGSDFNFHRIQKDLLKSNDNMDNVKRILVTYLERSDYLLVLCSANAVKSEYVNFEIDWFLENKGADKILLAVTDAPDLSVNLENIFSKSVLEHNLHKEIYYDLRGFKRNSKSFKKLAIFDEELTKIAAHLNGYSPGQLVPLWRMEERKRLKKRQYLLGSMASIFLLLSIAAFYLRSEAINQKEKAQNQTARIYWDNSQIEREKGNHLTSLLFASAAIGVGSDQDVTKNILTDVASSMPVASLKNIFPHTASLNTAVFSLDGKLALTASDDSTARIWNVEAGRLQVPPLRHNGPVRSAVFSPDNKFVLTAGMDGLAKLWETTSGKLVFPPMPHTDYISCAEFSRDGRKILTAGATETFIWDVQTGKKLYSNTGKGGYVALAGFSPSGRKVFISNGIVMHFWDSTLQNEIAPSFIPFSHRDVLSIAFGKNEDSILVCGTDNEEPIKLFRLTDGRKLGPSFVYDAPVYKAQFDSSGKRIVSAGDDGKTIIWETATGKRIIPVMQHESYNVTAVFSHNEKYVLTASFDGTARLWDASTGKQMGPSLKHDGPVLNANFSPDDKYIITAGKDFSAKIWKIHTPPNPYVSIQQDERVELGMFSPDGNQIATATSGDTVRLWNLKDGAQVGRSMENYATRSIDFSPDGKLLLTSSEDGYARLWKASTGEPTGRAMKQGNMITNAVFNKDGKRILTASTDGTAQLWDTRTGNKIGKPMKNGDFLSTAIFSPDEKLILTVCGDSSVRLWDASTQEQTGKTLKHCPYIFNPSFSPDGKLILLASAKNTGYIYDFKAGRKVGRDFSHISNKTDPVDVNINTAVFSPDGKMVLTVSEQTARLWDVKTGIQIGPAMQHRSDVNSALFSEDGKMIITAGSDSVVKIWEVGTGKQIGPVMQQGGFVKGARFNKDGSKVLTFGFDDTTRIWDRGRDLDIPPHLFSLQAMVVTGVELNTVTGELKCIDAAKWKELEKQYKEESALHVKECKYQKYNFWATVLSRN